MAILLNSRGYLHAQKLIKEGKSVEHGKQWNWNEHRATLDEQDKFIETHYVQEYGQWFLGIDTNQEPESMRYYVFPYGDLKIVHRNALVSIEKEAGAQGHNDIADAARKLREMVDSEKPDATGSY